MDVVVDHGWSSATTSSPPSSPRIDPIRATDSARLARSHSNAPMPMIDFRDEPAFAAFRLPDTSHIDGSDVPRFTRTLLDVLARRGIVAPSAVAE